MAEQGQFVELAVAKAGEVARARDTEGGTPLRFLGRQPILDHHPNLYGYELLFRAGTANAFSGDPEAATHQVIDNYLLLMPQETEGQAFVNCTREVLVTGIVTLLPPQTTVLEILEDIEPDEELIASCHALQKKGYRFALDDFSPEESKRPLLQFADFIKVDFRASDAAQRQAIYAMARSCGAKLLAEKVETEADVALARAEGCHYFQGYFFSRPAIVSQRAIPANHRIYMKILAALSSSPPRVGEMETLILSDPLLCYRLLRLVNSALYSLPSHVSSIRNALVLIGDDEVRKLVTIAMTGVYADNQPKALALLALERARFCELLAALLHRESSELYLLGMLSLIDVMVQTPMAEVLVSLPVSAEMKAALRGEQNGLGRVLTFVRCYEAGEWDSCEAWRTKFSLTEPQAAAIYVEAVRWAAKVMPR